MEKTIIIMDMSNAFACIQDPPQLYHPSMHTVILYFLCLFVFPFFLDVLHSILAINFNHLTHTSDTLPQATYFIEL